jgi:hypothetical protein
VIDENELRLRYPGITQDQWVELIRPAVGLSIGDDERGGDGPVVGQVGGEPSLPEGMWWPEWEGVGPLSFGVALDCLALSAFDVGFSLPSEGTLLFFCYDRQVEDELFVDLAYPASQAGARVVYVPVGTSVRPWVTPEPLRVHPARALHARAHRSAVPPEHPVRQAMRSVRSTAQDDHVEQALSDIRAAGTDVRHHVGGFPQSVHGDITWQVVASKLGRLHRESPMWTMEAARWITLLQFDSGGSDELPWGNLGRVFWLIRREDLAEGDFAAAINTWSTG